MDKTRELVRGTFWSYAGITLTLILGLATNVILARMLDKENWGALSTLITVVSFLTTLVDLGLNYFILYVVSSGSHKSQEEIRASLAAPLRYKLILVFLIGLSIFIFAEPLSAIFKIENGAIYFIESAVFFVVLNVFTVLDLIFSGLKRFRESSMITTLQNIIRLSVAYALVLFGFGITGAMTGYITAVFLSVVVQFILLRPYLSVSGGKKESVANMFEYGFFFGVSSLAATISLWTDSIIIGLFIGPVAVGVYRIAVSIAMSVGGLIGGVNKVIFPVLASAEGRGEDSINDLNRAIKYSSFIAFPAVVGLALSSDALVRVFFGAQYADSAIPLMLLSFICFDMMFTSLLSSYLGAKKRTKIIGYSAVATSIANVVLNVILIPFIGMIGAAIASVSTRLFNAFLLFEWSRRNLNSRIDLSSFSIPLMGSLGMGIVLLVIRQAMNPADSVIHLFVFVGIGMASYAAMSQLLGFNIFDVGKKILSAFIRPQS